MDKAMGYAMMIGLVGWLCLAASIMYELQTVNWLALVK